MIAVAERNAGVADGVHYQHQQQQQQQQELKQTPSLQLQHDALSQSQTGLEDAHLHVNLHSQTNGFDRDASASRQSLARDGVGLSRASSRRSIPEFIFPDTIKQIVPDDDCPVCQLMLPKGRNGCVRVFLSLSCQMFTKL